MKLGPRRSRVSGRTLSFCTPLPPSRALRYYPLILVLGWTAGTVNRVINTTTGAELYWLVSLHT